MDTNRNTVRRKTNATTRYVTRTIIAVQYSAKQNPTGQYIGLSTTTIVNECDNGGRERKQSRPSYQVYVDFGVAEGPAAAVAIDDRLGARFRRHLVDQIDGERWIHLLLLVNVTRQPVIVLFPFLEHTMRKVIVNDHWKRTRAATTTSLAGVRFHFSRFPREPGRLDEGRTRASRRPDGGL